MVVNPFHIRVRRRNPHNSRFSFMQLQLYQVRGVFCEKSLFADPGSPVMGVLFILT